MLVYNTVIVETKGTKLLNEQVSKYGVACKNNTEFCLYSKLLSRFQNNNNNNTAFEKNPANTKAIKYIFNFKKVLEE